MIDSLSYLFGGELKARVLQTLLMNPTQAYHLRGLAAEAGVESGNALRSLKGLVEAHLVKTVPDSRGIKYQANERSPIFEPLRQLFFASSALMNDLKDVAAGLPVEQVAVFGSTARGTSGPDSDVDVLVVGDISSIEAQAAFKPVSRKHGRAVSVLVIDAKALASQVGQGSEFWRDVLANKLVMLKGEKLDASLGATTRPE